MTRPHLVERLTSGLYRDILGMTSVVFKSARHVHEEEVL